MSQVSHSWMCNRMPVFSSSSHPIALGLESVVCITNSMMDGIAWEKQAINSPLPANLYTSRRCWSSGEQNKLVKHTTLIFPHFFAPATARRYTFSLGAWAEPACTKYHLLRLGWCSPCRQLKFGLTSAQYWMCMNQRAFVARLNILIRVKSHRHRHSRYCFVEKGCTLSSLSCPPLGFCGGGGERCCISPAADLWCFKCPCKHTLKPCWGFWRICNVFRNRHVLYSIYVVKFNHSQEVQHAFNGHMKAWIASSGNGGQVIAIVIFRPFCRTSAKIKTQRDAEVPISL